MWSVIMAFPSNTYLFLFVKYNVDLKAFLQRVISESVFYLFVCLFLLFYVPSQQLWSLRDGQFT